MIGFFNLFKVTQLVKVEPECKSRSVEFTSFSSLILPKLSTHEAKGQHGEPGNGRSPYTLACLSPFWRFVGSCPGLLGQIHLSMLQALSDVEISADFQRGHQDTEATLMPWLIIIANIHSGLTVCGRWPKLFTHMNPFDPLTLWGGYHHYPQVYSWGNWGTERSMNFPKFVEVVSGGSGFQRWHVALRLCTPAPLVPPLHAQEHTLWSYIDISGSNPGFAMKP